MSEMKIIPLTRKRITIDLIVPEEVLLAMLDDIFNKGLEDYLIPTALGYVKFKSSCPEQESKEKPMFIFDINSDIIN